MSDILFRLLLGHFMGDYLLQPLRMALNKSPRKPLPEGEEREGDPGVPLRIALPWSILHATLYSLAVCLWLWGGQIFAVIFGGLWQAIHPIAWHWAFWTIDFVVSPSALGTIGPSLLALNWHPWLFILIFLTHWPLDFFGVGDKVLKMIKGRTLKQAAEDKSPFAPFNIAFTAIVYTIVDNGIHVMLMYPVVLALQKGLI